MNDRSPTNKELLKENSALKKKIRELERSEEMHRRTEEALRVSEGCSRSLLDLPPDSVALLLDAKGVVLDFNANLPKRIGLKPDDLRGKCIFDLLSHDVAEFRRKKHEEILKTRKPMRVEDQSEGCWYEHVAYPLLGENGEVVRIAVLSFDITTRKSDREALRESEEKYRSMFENAVEGIYQVSLEGKYLRVNQALARMHGFESPEEMTASVADVGTEIFTNPAALRELLNILEAEGTAVNFEFELYRKDKSTIWVSTSARAVCNDRGEALYYEGRVEDITNRKAAERALKESEKLFRTVLDSIDAAVYVADMDSYEILFVNAYLKNIFGDITGQTCWKALQKDQGGPCLFCTNASLLTRSGEPTGPVTWEFFNPVAGYWIECHDRAIRWLDGRIVRIEVATDITARKRMEEELKKHRDHLEQLVAERTAEMKKSEKKYRDIFEEPLLGIYQSTPEGRFLMVNPYFARLHGYESPEELIESITDIATQFSVNPEDRKDFLGLMERDGFVRNFEAQAKTKDGAIRQLSINAYAVKDADGIVRRHDGVLLDITEKKLAQELLVRQRDLALKLAQTGDLQEGLAVILESAVMVSGMECGGILLKNAETGGFDLVSSIGLTQEFQDKIRLVPQGSFLWSYIMDKKILHTRASRDLTPVSFEEGFQIVSLMPVLARDDVTGCLLVASRMLTHIPEQVRTFLEFLASQSGNSIARMQVRKLLEAEISIRREAERALEAERQSLQEANIALKVLLKHREEDRRELEEKVVANVRQLVMPYVEKLKKSTADPLQQTSIGLVEANLSEIISPFLRTLKGFQFTPRQLEVAALIREGKTTKDIAGILNISKQAVDIQRFLIRKKLGLNKEKVNLQAYLKSLN